MNTAELIAHCQNSLEVAMKLKCPADPAVFKVKGFSTPTQRALFSNLCSPENTTYLEVGAFFGGTFCSAISNNPTIRAFAFEDFSQPFGETDNIREILPANIAKFAHPQADVRLIDRNFYATDNGDVPPVDVYFFDGEHSYESQKKALPHAFPLLKERFVFIVDDYAWEPVFNGTNDGIASLGDAIGLKWKWEVRPPRNDDKIWHNGLGVFVFEKR